MNMSSLLGLATLVVQMQTTNLSVTHEKPLYGWEIGIERMNMARIGWAISFRKEGALAYEGYWLSVSGMWYRRLSGAWYGMIRLGSECGWPGDQYSRYDAQYSDGRLVGQRWIHIVQNADVVAVNPFVGFAVVHPITDRVALRTGMNFRFLKFSDQESRRNAATGFLESTLDDQGRKVIPAFRIAVLLKF